MWFFPIQTTTIASLYQYLHPKLLIPLAPSRDSNEIVVLPEIETQTDLEELPPLLHLQPQSQVQAPVQAQVQAQIPTQLTLSRHNQISDHLENLEDRESKGRETPTPNEAFQLSQNPCQNNQREADISTGPVKPKVKTEYLDLEEKIQFDEELDDGEKRLPQEKMQEQRKKEEQRSMDKMTKLLMETSENDLTKTGSSLKSTTNTIRNTSDIPSSLTREKGTLEKNVPHAQIQPDPLVDFIYDDDLFAIDHELDSVM